MKPTAKVAIAVSLIAVAFALFIYFPIDQKLLEVVAWAQSAGPEGVAAFAVLYIVATVLMLPGSVLTLAAGFVYGPWYGLLLVSPVSVAAASASFLLGRSVARQWVARQLAKRPRFSAIDRAVGAQGFRTVALLRLSPLIPFNLLNYALSFTSVRFSHYVAASFLGMLPGTLLYIYLGSLFTNAAQLTSGQRPESGIWGQVFFWGGLVATVVVTTLITRASRRQLEAALGSATEANVK